MASLMRCVKAGAGLVGLGYGIYRLSRGKRDWVSTTAVSTGLSMALSGLAGRRGRKVANRVQDAMQVVQFASPRLDRLMGTGPRGMRSVRDVTTRLLT